jgi:hypothetical protein
MRSRHSTRLKLRVPAVYLSLAFLAFSPFVAICRINNLQPVNVACGFDSPRLHQKSTPQPTVVSPQLRTASHLELW